MYKGSTFFDSTALQASPFSTPPRVYQQERDQGAFSMLSTVKIDEPYSGAGVVSFENSVRRLLYSYL